MIPGTARWSTGEQRATPTPRSQRMGQAHQSPKGHHSYTVPSPEAILAGRWLWERCSLRGSGKQTQTKGRVPWSYAGWGGGGRQYHARLPSPGIESNLHQIPHMPPARFAGVSCRQEKATSYRASWIPNQHGTALEMAWPSFPGTGNGNVLGSVKGRGLENWLSL